MDLHLVRSAWLDADGWRLPGLAVAIGDVHGHLDHLDALLGEVKAVLRRPRAEGVPCAVVLVGDYIDRGPANLGVLRRVAGLGAELGVPVHALRGNHDQYLIDFLWAREYGREDLDLWLENDGLGMLRELGVEPDDLYRETLEELRERACRALPPELTGLLAGLGHAVRLGDWLFVHGGVHPSEPLAAQEPRSWLRLREPFLAPERWLHPFRVVHGHTIRRHEVLPHRIAIDSGCYKTGALSALVIEPERLRFLVVADDPELRRLEALRGDGPPLDYEPAVPIRAAG